MLYVVCIQSTRYCMRTGRVFLPLERNKKVYFEYKKVYYALPAVTKDNIVFRRIHESARKFPVVKLVLVLELRL